MNQKARQHLKKVDSILATIVAKDLSEFNIVRRSRFESLVEAIISQQLSVKAADTIFARFKLLFPGKKFPKPSEVVGISVARLRSVGISNSKANYILDLAQKVATKQLKLSNLHKLDDEAVIEELVKVKGIGRWTAEMFLMFNLGRPDVFSFGDLGLRNAIARLYKMKHPPTLVQLERITKKWSPYRTLAARYLWKSLEK